MLFYESYDVEVNDAIRFVCQKSKGKQESSSSSDENHKGLNEYDYNEDKYLLKGPIH
jgi:hypothetical protein